MNKAYFNHIIISLNNLPYNRYEEFLALSFLRDATIDEIWSHHPMVDGTYDPDTMTDEIAVLEPYIAMNYYKKAGYKDEQIEVHYDKSYFIHNQKLFVLEDDKIREIPLNGVLWLSFREAWMHPFYGILEVLLTQNGGKLYKPNKQTMQNVGCMNKFYCIKALYPKREEFLGDIIVPYNISRKEYDLFLSYVKDSFGDEIVLKQDCIQEGGGVYFKRWNDKNIYKLLDNHKTRHRELFIMPMYKIAAEYRVYFLKPTQDSKESQIFSIKERLNITHKDELLQKENLKIYQNISVEWRLIEASSSKFKEASNIAKKLLANLSYNFGALEFAITQDKKIVLFEVNQMAGVLPFSGDDTKNISEWYFKILDMSLKSYVN